MHDANVWSLELREIRLYGSTTWKNKLCSKRLLLRASENVCMALELCIMRLFNERHKFRSR